MQQNIYKKIYIKLIKWISPDKYKIKADDIE